MFGFPFVTSIIVVMLLVTIFSLILNRGFVGAARKGSPEKAHRSDRKHPNCHA